MKKVWKIAGLASLLLMLVGCTDTGRSEYELMQTTEVVKTQKRMKVHKGEYKIHALDRLSVVIYQYPELTPTEMNEKGILVDSQGYIALPLIHKVKVAGYTQSGAARMLESRYKKYLTDPALNLEVLNKRAYVLGEVNKPGVVVLDNEYMTVLQAIANAGDLTDAAQRNEVYVVSDSGREHVTMRRVDLTSFSAMQNSNMVIKPNDIIYVSPNKWKSFRVASDDFTSPFVTITKIAAPFVTLKYLSD
ncbi:MAG: polysaccharide biosynthesis/export family protein [Campylobacterota bacterium]|nr:polysaccharide biosynthesis/export family protein [Campylobacterota bacterium]